MLRKVKLRFLGLKDYKIIFCLNQNLKITRMRSNNAIKFTFCEFSNPVNGVAFLNALENKQEVKNSDSDNSCDINAPLTQS
ncbi:MAG: hypothetical protein JWQ54_4562 [Mucilaginibacter sp.]|nr:hypothetical protein [Mucilaginibacter sp.]